MFNSGIMLRLGKTANIHQQYEECRLTFSCPANWIMYAKQDASGIADEYEAIWGHVRKDDDRLKQKFDDGISLLESDLLEVIEDKNNNEFIYVRYRIFCLTPSICFYSRHIREEVLNKEEKLGEKIEEYEIDIRPYTNSLGLDIQESSFLVIRYPGKLWQELKIQIPIALKQSERLLNIEHVKYDDLLCIRDVDYSIDINNEFFQNKLHSYSPLFTKRQEYKDQCEARIIIQNVYFDSDLLIDKGKYDIKNFEFSVNLPNMHEYISEIPACGKHKMIFYDFDDNRENYHVRME